jgi:hypothetical protein
MKRYVEYVLIRIHFSLKALYRHPYTKRVVGVIIKVHPSDEGQRVTGGSCVIHAVLMCNDTVWAEQCFRISESVQIG